MRKLMAAVVVIFMLLAMTVRLFADPNLSIYEIQYTENSDGSSYYDQQDVNCTGGIVIHKSPSWVRPKLTLYDPNYPYGWGGIMAKDIEWTGAFDDVNVGDWVSFTNVLVEEFKGTTCLQYLIENDSNLAIVSRDNPLPKPITVPVGQIKAPVEGTLEWVVEDHSAEKYEAMFLKVVDVNVDGKEYGKAEDNYILQSNRDPNCCWASDYMNEDTNGQKYHLLVQLGQRFCGVTGILEQYTGTKYSVYYDYYQLLTTNTQGFTITQTADCDGDCDVDLADFSVFALYWLQDGCADPNWCDGADLTQNGTVNIFDLKEFSEHWLEGK